MKRYEMTAEYNSVGCYDEVIPVESADGDWIKFSDYQAATEATEDIGLAAPNEPKPCRACDPSVGFICEEHGDSEAEAEDDAYNYACELMEQGWKERAKRGVEIGTEGSLCDGIAWIFDRMKKLETEAAKATGTAGKPDDYVLMPRRLTAENGAKSLLIGEFKESVQVPCPECHDEGEDYACETCENFGTVAQDVPVGWDTIKRIYAMAVEHLSLAEAARQPAPVLAVSLTTDQKRELLKCLNGGVEMGWIEQNNALEISSSILAGAQDQKLPVLPVKTWQERMFDNAEAGNRIGSPQRFMRQEIADLRAALAAANRSQPGPETIPPAVGVSRDAESPSLTGVLVTFARPLSDGQLRELHEYLNRSQP